MSLESEIRAENKKVAYYLLNYPDLKRELEERRQAIINATHKPSENDPAPGRNTPREPSDPTGAVVVQLSELHERERWIQLCEDVAAGLPWKKQAFLRLRQDTRHASNRTGGWTSYVQAGYAAEAARRTGRRDAMECVPSRQALNQWWNSIVEAAVRTAIRRGLLE